MRACVLAGLAVLLGAPAAVASKDVLLPPFTFPDGAKGGKGSAAAALQTMRKALDDLPPGPERDAIAKALGAMRKRLEGDLVPRIKVAESDAEMCTERSAWSQRMLKRGFVSQAQAEADRARQLQAVAELQRLRAELRQLQRPAGAKD